MNWTDDVRLSKEEERLVPLQPRRTPADLCWLVGLKRALQPSRPCNSDPSTQPERRALDGQDGLLDPFAACVQGHSVITNPATTPRITQPLPGSLTRVLL